MQSLVDMTSLGLLALVIVFAYAFGSRLFTMLNAHLAAVQEMDSRQALLLEACLLKLSAIQDSLESLDSSSG